MWLMVSSLSPHSLHLLFCWVLPILALIWLVLIALFCAAIRRDSVSLLRFPFLSPVKVIIIIIIIYEMKCHFLKINFQKSFQNKRSSFLFLKYNIYLSIYLSLPFLFPSFLPFSFLSPISLKQTISVRCIDKSLLLSFLEKCQHLSGSIFIRRAEAILWRLSVQEFNNGWWTK